MAIQRANPIPIGRYWVDAIDATATLFADAWFAKHRSTVKLLRKEDSSGTGPIAPSWAPGRSWYLFEVLAPTERWQQVKGLGLPTIVQSPQAPNAPAVQTSADTVIKPKPATISDMFADFEFGSWKGLAIGALALYLLSNKGR